MTTAIVVVFLLVYLGMILGGLPFLQNMLIGSALGLSFAGYLIEAALPVLLGLVATWAIITWRARDGLAPRSAVGTAIQLQGERMRLSTGQGRGF